MSVYVSWSDESASADGQGWFLIAGYVAKETEWPDFSREWQVILNSHPPIPYIHMTEIRSRKWREQHNISEEQANGKVDKAVRLIVDAGYLSAYTTRLPEGVYSNVRQKFRKKGLGTGKHQSVPDYPCFAMYARGVVSDIVSKHSDLTKITFNISKKKFIDNYIQIAQDAAALYFAEIQPELVPLIGDVVPLSMEDHKPLQAADVFGWYLQRIYADNVTPEDEPNATAITANALSLTFTEQALEETAEKFLERYKAEGEASEE